jgi:4-alpha-glucanotransferase
MLLERASGILLHPSSFPNGVLDKHAFRFVDWLAAAEQRWWQVLPLGPPDAFGSPYTSPSAFAGAPTLLAEPDAPVSEHELDDFRSRQAYWIGNWARFSGDPDAVADQIRFEREWLALRRYAAERGIRVIGDLPIYVARRGAAQAAHPEYFLPGLVAGAAPDASHPEGQLWGQPVYDWRAMRAEGYRWWIERFRHAFGLFDLVRIDHFRGFVAYWVIPEGAVSPLEGRWHRGPGFALFRAVEAELGRPLPLVAEDLGLITPAVDRLREQVGALSMRIIGRSFSARHRNRQGIAGHPENAVVYTGTHDHPTIAGYWAVAPPDERERALEDLAAAGIADPDPIWALVRLTLSSRARLAILPVQDLLELGNEARMNSPGTVSERNWSWRLEPGQLTAELGARLREATIEGGRAARALAPRRDSELARAR